MNSIIYERFYPHINNNLLSSVIECYQQVFATGPWHEWKQCVFCSRYWGKEHLQELEDIHFIHCGAPVIDFWPTEKVCEELYSEITERASCWIARDGERVVGFAYGYPIGIKTLEKKLGIEFSQQLFEFFNFSELEVIYQDDMGVLEEYRGQKIAKNMFLHRLKDFLKQNISIGVVRTREKPEPSKTFLWFQRDGYKIIARYSNDDGRVVLAQQLQSISLLYQK